MVNYFLNISSNAVTPIFVPKEIAPRSVLSIILFITLTFKYSQPHIVLPIQVLQCLYLLVL